MTAHPAADLTVYFDFSSPYSYLSVMRLPDLVRERALTVRYAPIVLGAIFNKLGWESSPFKSQPLKMNYMWRDMERQSRQLGLRYRKPSEFPVSSINAARVVSSAPDADWIPEFCQTVFQAYFECDRDINSPDSLIQILDGLGLDGETQLQAAMTEDNKLRLRHLTDQALMCGVFGAPSVVVGHELFWGNDRLDEALDYAQAFKASHPRNTVIAA
ncbi:2-hydroxychromene-2-carboxylate isomerase [Limnobacter humi]|uniref:2-hydroxychromene-2-carboxylate isomerase n=1 Tax=Limnobacter humi TaxID=1778671 RepID=A0ABT1WBR9_9BURK|nr:2-hydroxychromene-2-carboxylate isomerase [Limnobacter humi]MCQ8894960.1 2-hydroxychromene-2-carboxylate isomerase [Limnobacter humi]